MSLKFFHILFVIASTLLMAMFAMWSWREYRQTHAAEDLALGIIAIVAPRLSVSPAPSRVARRAPVWPE